MLRNIEAHSTPNIWHLADLAPVLEIYADQEFDTSGAQTWLPGDVSRQDIFRSVQLSIASDQLVFPLIAQLDTTEDSPTNQRATYSAYIRAANREPIPWLLQFRVPPSTTMPVSSISWTALRILKNGVIARNVNETLTRQQITDLLELLIQETVQGIHAEVPAGTINGVNAVFTLSREPVLGSVMIYLNGSLQQEANLGAGTESYTIAGSVITHYLPPQPGDRLFATYRTSSGLLAGAATGTVEGVGALVAGATTTIPSAAVAVDSAIECIPKDDGITGHLRPGNRVAGASFDVTSDNGADAGNFKWIIHL